MHVCFLVLCTAYACELVEKSLNAKRKIFSILFFYMKNFFYIRIRNK